MKKILSIEGMRCPHCSSNVEKALKGIAGVVRRCVFQFEAGRNGGNIQKMKFHSPEQTHDTLDAEEYIYLKDNKKYFLLYEFKENNTTNLTFVYLWCIIIKL